MIANPGAAPEPSEDAPSWASSLGQALSLTAAPAQHSSQRSSDSLTGWRLLAIMARTPAGMQEVLIRDGQWDSALALSAAHGLSEEPVYRARWAHQPMSPASISANLGGVTDRRWVIEQYLDRAADTEAFQRVVLQSALEETGTQYALHSVESPTDGTEGVAGEEGRGGVAGTEVELRDDALWWLCKRLCVLQHIERLNTLCAMYDG